jgi:hypothetical protein
MKFLQQFRYQMNLLYQHQQHQWLQFQMNLKLKQQLLFRYTRHRHPHY